MQLTLDLDAEEHRKILAQAAVHGQTVTAFILSRLRLEEGQGGAHEAVNGDETAYLFSTPANAEHLERALKGKPEGRIKFDSVEDVKRALGV
jgi:hypothetical protein